jgi:hypothetical protein
MSAEGLRRLAERAGLIVAGLLLLAQAANFASVEASTFALQSRLVAEPVPGQRLSPSQLALAAYRALAELAPQIPRDERVLLVSDSEVPVAWDFQLLPRPLRVLFTVDETTAALVARRDEVVSQRLALWHAEIDRRDQRLTPEALLRRLRESRWLITVSSGGEPPALPPQPPLRRVAVSGPATLYRVESP